MLSISDYNFLRIVILKKYTPINLINCNLLINIKGKSSGDIGENSKKMAEYRKVAEQAYEDIWKDIHHHIMNNKAGTAKLVRVPNRAACFYEIYVGGNKENVTIPVEHIKLRDMTLVDASPLVDLPSLLKSELETWRTKNSSNPFPEEIQIIQPNWARDIWAVFLR